MLTHRSGESERIEKENWYSRQVVIGSKFLAGLRGADMLYPGAAYHARARRAMSNFNRRQEAEVQHPTLKVIFKIVFPS